MNYAETLPIDVDNTSTSYKGLKGIYEVTPDKFENGKLIFEADGKTMVLEGGDSGVGLGADLDFDGKKNPVSVYGRTSEGKLLVAATNAPKESIDALEADANTGEVVRFAKNSGAASGGVNFGFDSSQDDWSPLDKDTLKIGENSYTADLDDPKAFQTALQSSKLTKEQAEILQKGLEKFEKVAKGDDVQKIAEIKEQVKEGATVNYNDDKDLVGIKPPADPQPKKPVPATSPSNQPNPNLNKQPKASGTTPFEVNQNSVRDLEEGTPDGIITAGEEAGKFNAKLNNKIGELKERIKTATPTEKGRIQDDIDRLKGLQKKVDALDNNPNLKGISYNVDKGGLITTKELTELPSGSEPTPEPVVNYTKVRSPFELIGAGVDANNRFDDISSVNQLNTELMEAYAGSIKTDVAHRQALTNLISQLKSLKNSSGNSIFDSSSKNIDLKKLFSSPEDYGITDNRVKIYLKSMGTRNKAVRSLVEYVETTKTNMDSLLNSGELGTISGTSWNTNIANLESTLR